MKPSLNRRQALRAGGVTVTLAIAGCTGLFTGEIEFDEEVPDEVAEHLSGANNVDGSITDLTGENTAIIETGPSNNFEYDPALARVDAGTTVRWEWKSDGHTVTSESTPAGTEFDADGDEFTERFDQPGSVLYFCRPHQGQGHLGALIVE